MKPLQQRKLVPLILLGLAFIFGLVICQFPGLYLTSIVASTIFSIAAVVILLSASARKVWAQGMSRPLGILTVIFSSAAAVASIFRLGDFSNEVPVQSGFDLLGWLVASILAMVFAAVTILQSENSPLSLTK